MGALTACSFSDAGVPRRRSPYFRRHKGGGRVHEKSEATPRFLFYFSFMRRMYKKRMMSSLASADCSCSWLPAQRPFFLRFWTASAYARPCPLTSLLVGFVVCDYFIFGFLSLAPRKPPPLAVAPACRVCPRWLVLNLVRYSSKIIYPSSEALRRK